MKKIWYSVLFSAALGFQMLYASDNEGMEYPQKIVNGKTYYEYTVQKGEGFYSICKKFNVTEEEIKAVNPCCQNGLGFDTTILIPYKIQKYTLHKVDRKETLYSISKRYELAITDITDMNPELKERGLKSGMMIKIPEKPKKSNTMTVSDTLQKIVKNDQPSFSVHEVVKGETIYSISRSYGITTEEIIRLNPDVKDGVKIGKKLIIPPLHSNTGIRSNSVEGKNVQFTTHLVQKKETLFSISQQYGVTHDEIVKLNPSVNDGLKEGMVLIIPPSFNAKPEETVSDSVPEQIIALDSITNVKDLFPRSLTPQREINVAIALPFQLSKVSDKNKIDGNTKKFLEFYQGFLLAVDSLKRTGLSFNIRTFDSGKNETDIQKVLEHPDMKSLDLLIGPAYTAQIKPMADFALENNIKLVIPFSSKSDETHVNPNVFQINSPAEKSFYNDAELFIKAFKDKNIVLWRFKNAAYDDKKLFADTLSFLLTEKKIPFKIVYFDNIATLRAALSSTQENIIVPLTSNQVALSQALPMVNMLTEDKRVVELFGFPEWQNYQSISKDLYVLTTYYATPFHVDFKKKEVRNYLSKFRHFYNAEPFNSQPQYGMVGYDVCFYFASHIASLGHDFEFADKELWVHNLQSHFHFTRIEEKGGFYSDRLYLVKHDSKTGLVAKDGFTLAVCPICAENLKTLESQK